jgi:hypothetical protein
MKPSLFSNASHARSITDLLLVSVIYTSLLIAGCGSDSTASAPPTQAALQSLYSSASYDARTVTPEEISTDLTPITSDNRNLIWENGVPGSVTPMTGEAPAMWV